MGAESKEFFNHTEKVPTKIKVAGPPVEPSPGYRSWRDPKPEPTWIEKDGQATLTAKCGSMVWDNGAFNVNIELGIGISDKNIHGWVAEINWKGLNDNTLKRHETSTPSYGKQNTHTRHDDFILGCPPTASLLLRLVQKLGHSGGILVDKKKMKGNSEWIEKPGCTTFPQQEAVVQFQKLISKFRTQIDECVKWTLETKSKFQSATQFNTVDEVIAKPGVYFLLHRRHGYKLEWKLSQGTEWRSVTKRINFSIKIDSTKLGEIEHARVANGCGFTFHVQEERRNDSNSTWQPANADSEPAAPENCRVVWEYSGSSYETRLVKNGDFSPFLDLEDLIARTGNTAVISAMIALLGEQGFDRFAANYAQLFEAKLIETGLKVTQQDTHMVQDESKLSFLSRTQRFLSENT